MGPKVAKANVDLRERLGVVTRANESVGREEAAVLAAYFHDPQLLSTQRSLTLEQYAKRELDYVNLFTHDYLGSSNRKALEDFLDELARFEAFPRLVVGIFNSLVNNGGPNGIELRAARTAEMLSDGRLLEGLRQFEGAPAVILDNIIAQLVNSVYDAGIFPGRGGAWRHVESMVEVMSSHVYKEMVSKIISSGSKNTMDFVVAIAVECRDSAALERVEMVFSLGIGYSKEDLDSFTKEEARSRVREIARSDEQTEPEKALRA